MPFNIMATDTALDISPGLFSMQPSARAGTEGRKTGDQMGCRLEPTLRYIPSSLMTLHTKRLCFVARTALRLPCPCIDAVCEAIVQLVDILQEHFLRRILRRSLCRRLRHQVLLREKPLETGCLMTLLTEPFGMA